MNTLPLSPLTHEELNRRAADAVEAAGHRAISVARVGGDRLTPGAAAKFAECAAEFELYNGAACARVGLEVAA